MAQPLWSAISLVKIAITFALSLALIGCSQEAPNPIELMFGLKSYSSTTEVNAEITAQKGNWEVIESSKLSPADLRPEFSITIIETKLFTDAQFTGTTRIEFYNNKLTKVSFFPDDWRSYSKFLQDNRNVVIKNGRWEKYSKTRYIWIASDYLKKFYIASEDRALVKAMRSWLMKYA